MLSKAARMHRIVPDRVRKMCHNFRVSIAGESMARGSVLQNFYTKVEKVEGTQVGSHSEAYSHCQ